MPINFPDAPTLDQIHVNTESPFVSWRWDGNKWVMAGGGGGGGGEGDITDVVAGAGLTGGGTTGSVTISLSTPVTIPRGGTNAITGPLALDSLSGVSGILAGGLSRASNGVWSLASYLTNNQVITLSGAITGTGTTGITTTIANDAVVTAKILNSNVTFSKIQNITASRLLGNPTVTSAAPSEITLGTNLSFSGNVLNATGGGGGGATVTTDDVAPAGVDGDLWFDTISAQLYIRYDDGTSTQWVLANNLPGPQGPEGPPGGSANVSGLTSGQIAIAGSATSLTSSIPTSTFVARAGDTMTGNLNINVPTASDVILQLHNSFTGTAGTDGFELSIGAAGHAALWNYENTPIYFGTNNILRLTLEEAGNAMFSGAITAVGGTLTDHLTINKENAQLNVIHGPSSSGYFGCGVGEVWLGSSESIPTVVYVADVAIAVFGEGGLNIIGDISFPGALNYTGGAATFLVPAGGTVPTYFKRSAAIYFIDNAEVVKFAFNNTNGAASKSGGGTWADTSDIRTKEEISAYTSGLQEVTKLEPITYKKNGEYGTSRDGKTYIGLIANDARKVMPEMVSVATDILDADGKANNSEEILSLDATALIYALVNSVKELSAKVQSLEEKLS